MQGICQLQLDRGRRRAPSVNSIVSEHPSNLDPQHHRHPVLPLAPSVSDLSAAPARRGLAAVPDFYIDERIDLTAITRTEERFGLKKKPKGDEYLGLLIREFRQVNETLVLGLDVIKLLVHPLLTCLSHAFPLTGF